MNNRPFRFDSVAAKAIGYIDCISTEGLDATIECPEYDTKPCDGEASILLKLWGMWRVLSLPLLPSPLWIWNGLTCYFQCIDQIEMSIFFTSDYYYY